MSNHMSGPDFKGVETKDLRGTKTGRGGFIPPETAGDQPGNGGPKARGKEANTARVPGMGREFSKAQVKNPSGDGTPVCEDW